MPPIVSTNRHERLTAQFPAQPVHEVTVLAGLWSRIVAAYTADTGAPLPAPFAQFGDLLEQVAVPPQDDHVAEIYYHRLTNSELEELAQDYQVRGVLKQEAYWLAICQKAIDAWNQEILDVDLNPIPVPPAGRTQREQLAAIVANFPDFVLPVVANLARTHMPDEIKKNWIARYGATSSSPIAPQGRNTPVTTAANGTTDASGSVHPATPAG